MTTSLLCVLIYALWTLCPVIFGVGAYRVFTVLTGGRPANGFTAGVEHDGPDWYHRANRAHLNCVENLPVFACVILVGMGLNVESDWWNTLAITTVVTRVLQSSVHIVSTSPIAVQIRFTFFSIQLGCIGALSGLIFMQVLSS